MRRKETRGPRTLTATICVTEKTNAALKTYGKTTTTVLVIHYCIAAVNKPIRIISYARAALAQTAAQAMHSLKMPSAHATPKRTAVLETEIIG